MPSDSLHMINIKDMHLITLRVFVCSTGGVCQSYGSMFLLSFIEVRIVVKNNLHCEFFKDLRSMGLEWQIFLGPGLAKVMF